MQKIALSGRCARFNQAATRVSRVTLTKVGNQPLTTNRNTDNYMKRLVLILFMFSLLASCEKKDPANNLVVIVRYKTQPNRSVDAITGLNALIEEVKKEDHFVSLRIHVDQNDNSNILLYEEWDDELYYKNQHMKTEHLQKFIADSQAFLAGPPDITFWKVNAVYK